MRSNFALGIVAAAFVCVSTNAARAQQPPPQAQVSPQSPNKPPQVTGSGTTGSVPVWSGSNSLSDSHIRSENSAVSVDVPVQVTSSVTAVQGISTHPVDGRGVMGISNGELGVGVQGDGALFGVSGHALGPVAPETACCVTGVIGSATNSAGIAIGVGGYVSTTDGWGTQGLNLGGGTGVLAQSRGGNHTGSGLIAQTEIGDAGTFLADAGGILLHGYLVNVNGSWDEKFNVDTGGDLTISGTAFKPGGGSWTSLSDRRTKKSIEPIDGALNQLLHLHGVTFEYSNPSAVHELPGQHIGMVAQDVEQVFPSWVDTGKDGYKRLTFRGFEAVAVEAVRELDTEINENSARIEKLERENAELKRSLEALMEKLNSR